jgi:hypothetical protein
VKLKQGHWFCIAFTAAAILIFLHAKLSYNQTAQASIDNGLANVAITSAAAFT